MIRATMRLFGIFRKKEKEKKKEATVTKPAEKSLLAELCGKDKELYEALSRTILLNPQMTAKGGIDPYVEKAEAYEKNRDNIKARISYQVAGEISLYEGKLAQIQKFFKKAAEVDPNYGDRKVFEYLSKKENAERALRVAQEYYTKTKKGAETKESSIS